MQRPAGPREGPAPGPRSGILARVRIQFDYKYASALLLLCAALQTSASASAQSGGAAVGTASAGSLRITQAWSRPTAPVVSVGAVYFSITNLGQKADILLALSSSVASQVEIHESRSVQGVMQMRRLSSLACPPGATVKIEPGAVHVMLLGLVRPLVAGAQFDLTLRFRDAGTLTLKVPVEVHE
jgi:periplasmic copper chaperone A